MKYWLIIITLLLAGCVTQDTELVSNTTPNIVITNNTTSLTITSQVDLITNMTLRVVKHAENQSNIFCGYMVNSPEVVYLLDTQKYQKPGEEPHTVSYGRGSTYPGQKWETCFYFDVLGDAPPETILLTEIYACEDIQAFQTTGFTKWEEDTFVAPECAIKRNYLKQLVQQGKITPIATAQTTLGKMQEQIPNAPTIESIRN